MQKTKGFTLIELLVVIAIIGILAAIVFVNVNSARKSAKDAAVTANLSQFQVSAEQYYGINTNYSGVCTAGAQSPYAAFLAASASSGMTGNNFCNQAATTYVACVELVNAANKGWCVDNTGTKKQILNTACVTGLTVCP